MNIIATILVIIIMIAGFALLLRGFGLGGAARGTGRGVGAVFRGAGRGIVWCWRRPRLMAGIATFAVLNAPLAFPFAREAVLAQGWVMLGVLEALLVVVATGAWSGRNTGHVVGTTAAIIALCAMVVMLLIHGSATTGWAPGKMSPATAAAWNAAAVPRTETLAIAAGEERELVLQMGDEWEEKGCRSLSARDSRNGSWPTPVLFGTGAHHYTPVVRGGTREIRFRASAFRPCEVVVTRAK